MNNSVWLDLFRIIPAKYHDVLAVVSITGQEIIIQQFYRFDSEVVVMRARLSGSMEGSRIIMLPYAHIDYLCFTCVLPESEIDAIFGGGAASPPPAAVAVKAGEPVAFTAPPAPLAPNPVVAPMTMGPGASLSTAQLQTRPTPPPAPVGPAPKPAATAPTTPVPETAAQANPGQVSKSLLLARLRERLGQKK